MENGGFASKEQMLHFPKYCLMIFQRRQKALLWNKGLNTTINQKQSNSYNVKRSAVAQLVECLTVAESSLTQDTALCPLSKTLYPLLSTGKTQEKT